MPLCQWGFNGQTDPPSPIPTGRSGQRRQPEARPAEREGSATSATLGATRRGDVLTLPQWQAAAPSLAATRTRTHSEHASGPPGAAEDQNSRPAPEVTIEVEDPDTQWQRPLGGWARRASPGPGDHASLSLSEWPGSLTESAKPYY